MAVLIEAHSLSKIFRHRAGWWPGTQRYTVALDGVSLILARRASLGLVGESGCGKSTLARILIGLDQPTEGELLWEGQSTARFSRTAWRQCWRKVQYVFQDAQSALNPRHRLGRILEAPLTTLLHISVIERGKRVSELLEQVGLASSFRDRYPHELSGGQAQRAVLARALAVKPQGLILDEPVSALDVSIQAQILALLHELRSRLDLTYLLISHDLAVVEQLCDEVAVMKNGRVVERGRSSEVFRSPKQAYTKALINAAPSRSVVRPARERRRPRM
jgi:peptide/nickel transport system ATP-binding protein